MIEIHKSILVTLECFDNLFIFLFQIKNKQIKNRIFIILRLATEKKDLFNLQFIYSKTI